MKEESIECLGRNQWKCTCQTPSLRRRVDEEVIDNKRRGLFDKKMTSGSDVIV